jgi:allene oxide cyclase-like protein
MRNKLGLTAIIALPLAAASITLTSASASSGSPAQDRAQVIHLVGKAVSNTDVDLGKKGLSQADQEIVRYNVFQGGKKIGEAGQACQFTRVTKAFITELCQIALTLPQGQVTVQGLIKGTPAAGPGTFFLAITGGTGAYQTARGQAKISASAGGVEEVPVTLYLIL